MIVGMHSMLHFRIKKHLKAMGDWATSSVLSPNRIGNLAKLPFLMAANIYQGKRSSLVLAILNCTEMI